MTSPIFHGAVYKRGQVAIVVIVIFLFIASAIVAAVASPVLKHIRLSRDLTESRKSFFLAESGVDEVIYKFQKGYTVSSLETLDINGSVAQTSVTDTAAGKTITAVGNVNSAIRNVQAKISHGVGVAFNYGVQVGNGGLIFSNNAGVNGNVYANGDIFGANNAYITGSAIAANSAALQSNQQNNAPATPPNTIVFGNAAGTQDMAQSFELSTTSPLNKIQLYIKKTSTPANATVRIVTDNGGSPSANELTTGVLSASLVTTTYGWIDVTFADNPELTASTTYWFIIDGGTDAARYYTLGANATYPSGGAKVGGYNSTTGGTWNNTTPSGLDAYFTIYLGGLTGSISNLRIGTGSVGTAQAHGVTGSSIAGALYCQTGSGNNKACNTSLPDPVPVSFPISDANIAEWQAEAAAGTTFNGNYSPGGSAVSWGPGVITGDLNLSNNFILTLTGTVWVQGSIHLSNNSIIKLATGYGSSGGVVLTDNPINLSNNATFQGSGQSGSYILLLTTSDCPQSSSCGGTSAIELGNNVGAVIVNAQKGRIHFSNNATVKEATAYEIELDNNVQIIYDSGLTSVNFSNGPSGAWQVNSWKETQ